jgi:hypothetical protein
MEGLDMTWAFTLVAGITLGAVAVGVPMALIKTLWFVETAGSWTLEQVHRLMRRRSAAARRESSDLLGLPQAEPAPVPDESS